MKYILILLLILQIANFSAVEFDQGSDSQLKYANNPILRNSVTPGRTAVYSVSFNHVFSSIPKVIISHSVYDIKNTPEFSARPMHHLIEVENVTTTGFTYRLTVYAGRMNQIYIKWFAVIKDDIVFTDVQNISVTSNTQTAEYNLSSPLSCQSTESIVFVNGFKLGNDVVDFDIEVVSSSNTKVGIKITKSASMVFDNVAVSIATGCSSQIQGFTLGTDDEPDYYTQFQYQLKTYQDVISDPSIYKKGTDFNGLINMGNHSSYPNEYGVSIWGSSTEVINNQLNYKVEFCRCWDGAYIQKAWASALIFKLCADNQYKGTFTCIDCDISCATCDDASGCTLDCNSNCGDQGCQTNGHCINCKAGYYLENDGTCSQCDHSICSTCTSLTQCTTPCDYNCSQCNASSSTCQACGNNRGAAPNCTCNSSYYDEGSLQDCVLCPVGKYINSSSQCINCPNTCDSQGCNSQAKCIACIDGYFKDQNQDCIQCDHTKCSTCTSLTQCTTPCDYNCSSCNASSSICQACGSNRRSAPNCECNSNFYDEGTQKDCTSCPVGKYVNNTSFCVDCPNTCGSLGCNTQAKCLNCIDGYFLDQNSDCQQCDHSICQTCTSLTQCTTPCDYNCSQCNASSSSCQACGNNRSSAPACSCNSGYYDEGILQDCVLCPVGKYINNSSKCVDCPNTCDSQGCNNQGKCVVCVDGYFLDQISDCQQCDYSICQTCTTLALCTTPCDYNCSQCNASSSTCQACGNNRGSAPNCECVANHYDEGNQQDCVLCPVGKYINNSSQCVDCPNTCNSQGCDSQAKCVACIDGYFKDQNLDCQQCDHSICQTCTTLTQCTTPCDYNCSQCSASFSTCQACGNNRNSAPTCTCNSGYYDEGSLQDCVLCTVGKYINNSSQCVDCPNTCDSQGCNNQGKCVACIDGYFKDQNQDCQQCDHTKCSTCISLTQCTTPCDYNCQECNASSSTCQTCGNNRGSAPNCECVANHYDGGNQQDCASCPVGKYVNNSSQCVNCPNTCDSQGCNNLGKCIVCIDGYFLDQNSDCQQCDHSICQTCTSLTQCTTPCDYNCSQCNSSSSSCQVCGNNRESAPNCECIANHYDEGTQKNCNTCPVGKYVNNTSFCVDCPNTCDSQGCNNQGKCVACVDGYFLNQNSDCIQCDHTKCSTCSSLTQCITPCDYNCQECSASSSSCTTCAINRSGPNCDCNSNHYDQSNLKDCLQCPAGKFVDSNSECLDCDVSCGTCENTSTNCIIPCDPSCGSDGCNIQGFCQDCLDGQFLDGNFICQDCDFTKCATCNSIDECILTCEYNCQECSLNNSQCQVCGGNRQNTPTCECQQGYYDEGQTLKDCLLCEAGKYVDNNSNCIECDNTQCATCINNSTNCVLSCDQNCGDQGCNPNGKCLDCVDGYYLDQNEVCQPCDNSVCGTCSNSSTSCIVPCQLGCSSCNTDGSCQSCQDGYFQQGSDCIECQSPCQNCTSETNCLTCDSLVRDSNANCSCITGYYESQSQCLQCSPQCKSCEQESDKCTSCVKGLNKNQAPECSCKIGFTIDQNNPENCVSCPPLCAECDSNQICTKCLFFFFKPPFCRPFLTSFFEVEKEAINSCSQTFCESCSPQNECLQCKINIPNRSTELPCSCLTGFYQDQYLECLPCDLNCLTCDSQPNYCTSCHSDQNRYLDEINLTCDCKSGFKENSELQCQKCYQFEQNCHFKCPKNTIQNEQNHTCELIHYNEQSNLLYIILFGVLIFITLTSQIYLKKIYTKQDIKELPIEIKKIEDSQKAIIMDKL